MEIAIFRITLLVAALLPAAALAQQQTPPAAPVQRVTQAAAPSAESGKTSARPVTTKPLPFPDMMSAWEYSAKEWK